jgi:hypothetical protein
MKVWRDTPVACFKILSQLWPVEAKENHGLPRS